MFAILSASCTEMGAPVILKQGPLKKKGGTMGGRHNWKERYFVLSDKGGSFGFLFLLLLRRTLFPCPSSQSYLIASTFQTQVVGITKARKLLTPVKRYYD